MASFICIKIYFLCLTILCIRGEHLFSFENKAEKSPFQSVLLQKLFQNKLPLRGGEAVSSVIGDNLSIYKQIKNGFDFPEIDSVFQQNLPFQKNEKSEQALDFPKTDNAFSDNLPTQNDDKPNEDVKPDLQKTKDGTYNYVYFVQVKPNVSVRSIIVANVSCNHGYRKDRTGKCRKML